MRKPRQILRGILFATIACLLLAGPAQALQVGEKAPDFTLPAPDGKPVKLGDLLGKGPVVIFTFIQAFGGA
jgi:peroxiredoxin Q/BCP